MNTWPVGDTLRKFDKLLHPPRARRVELPPCEDDCVLSDD